MVSIFRGQGCWKSKGTESTDRTHAESHAQLYVTPGTVCAKNIEICVIINQSPSRYIPLKVLVMVYYCYKVTTHFFFAHQITAMYIDGHLKGGFQTVEAYAGFCGYFKNWLDTKSIKLSVPRQGEMVAEDYRACLEYVNSEVSDL